MSSALLKELKKYCTIFQASVSAKLGHKAERLSQKNFMQGDQKKTQKGK